MESTFPVGFRAKNRVTILHDRIRLGKIEIPELYNIIPGAFGKHKGIRVKFKELGYESILKGGMTARVTRQHKKSPPIKKCTF